MVGPEVWKLSTAKIDTPSARKLSISTQVKNMQGRIRGWGMVSEVVAPKFSGQKPYPQILKKIRGKTIFSQLESPSPDP